MSKNEDKENIFWLDNDGIQKILTINPLVKLNL